MRALDDGLEVRVPIAMVGQVWRGGPVITSDPGDIAAVGPTLEIITIWSTHFSDLRTTRPKTSQAGQYAVLRSLGDGWSPSVVGDDRRSGVSVLCAGSPDSGVLRSRIQACGR